MKEIILYYCNRGCSNNNQNFGNISILSTDSNSEFLHHRLTSVGFQFACKFLHYQQLVILISELSAVYNVETPSEIWPGSKAAQQITGEIPLRFYTIFYNVMLSNKV